LRECLEAAARLETRLERLLERTRRQDRLRNRRRATDETTGHLVALGVTTARAGRGRRTLGARLLGLTAALRRGAADLGATAELATARTRLGVARLARSAGLLLARLEKVREIGRIARDELNLLATRHLVALGVTTARAGRGRRTLGARLLGLAAALRRGAADLGATADLATAAARGTERLAGRALFASLENLGNATTFDGRHLLYTVQAL
jgi:hypothetical protein